MCTYMITYYIVHLLSVPWMKHTQYTIYNIPYIMGIHSYVTESPTYMPRAVVSSIQVCNKIKYGIGDIMSSFILPCLEGIQSRLWRS